MFRKKYLNIPLGVWFAFAAIPFILYSMYIYTDVVWTTKNALTIWYLLFDGKSIGEFYITPYPLDSNIQHAYYDFFIYIIFAIWDIPLFIYEKISETSFMHNYFTLWYAKSIILPFWIVGIFQIYKLAYIVLDDKEKAGWSIFSYIFSVMTFQTIVVIGGYDVISLLFTLCGINAYLENRNKKFLAYFACAIACKMFALWVFVPLVLLRWKKIWKVLTTLVIGVSIIFFSKGYFILYEKISGIDSLDEVDTAISHVSFINEYLWGNEAPIAIMSIPLFFFFTFILWVSCWFYREKLSNKKIIYVVLLGMAIFFLTCQTHPYWIILVIPYIAILECNSWNNLSIKLFLETCSGISYILFKAMRHSEPCYSYSIVNNMLKLEEYNDDFRYIGLYTLISKLSDITQLEMNNLYTLFQSIFAASFIMLLIYLVPKKENQAEFPEKGRQYFYLKACCCVLISGIPLLGVLVRAIIS